jgi:hypothetical protein
MKKLERFLDKAPMWQIYIFGWIFTGTFIGLLFYGFSFIEPRPDIEITARKCVLLGVMTGAIFGLMVMLMISMMRKSQIFWEYSKEVEKLIEEADSKEKLEAIFEGEFQDLRKKCQGGPQIPELSRLHTIMKTKYKYV